jgi:hypothetical protein
MLLLEASGGARRPAGLGGRPGGLLRGKLGRIGALVDRWRAEPVRRGRRRPGEPVGHRGGPGQVGVGGLGLGRVESSAARPGPGEVGVGRALGDRAVLGDPGALGVFDPRTDAVGRPYPVAGPDPGRVVPGGAGLVGDRSGGGGGR